MKRFKYLQPLIEFCLKVLKNRYAATAILGLGWVMFISDVDLFYIFDEQIQLNRLKSEVYETKLKNDELRLRLIEIKDNPAVLERVARERYFMKQPKEEVYRIVD